MDGDYSINYEHEDFGWTFPMQLKSATFKNDNKDVVSGMEIIASINNYDIIKE